jgi:hypothetical protein
MLRRGHSSFAILFIVNPIVILFYQNCSVLPVHSKTLQTETNQIQIRKVASASDTAFRCQFTNVKPCAE